MLRELTKGVIMVFTVLIAFILLLLLPREIQITHISGLVFRAEFPFSWEVYKSNIRDFIHYIELNNGFGNTRTGSPISDEVRSLILRSSIIIFPCFFLSLLVGTLIGSLQFYYCEKVFGKILSGISWFLSSIPDFFLYIALQYLLILLMRNGLLHFSLFGHEKWYNFIIPVLAVMLFPTSHIAKYIFTSLSTEANEDYIRTSYSKGLINIQILIHMFKNSLNGLLNQTQVIMLYILTSLPIIEKLSSYRGAGYELLESILNNEDSRAIAYLIPFLVIMLLTIYLSETIKRGILPHYFGGEQI